MPKANSMPTWKLHTFPSCNKRSRSAIIHRAYGERIVNNLKGLFDDASIFGTFFPHCFVSFLYIVLFILCSFVINLTKYINERFMSFNAHTNKGKKQKHFNYYFWNYNYFNSNIYTLFTVRSRAYCCITNLLHNR